MFPVPLCAVSSCALVPLSRCFQNVLLLLCLYPPTRRLHMVWVVKDHSNDAWVVGRCQIDSAEFSLCSSVQLMILTNLKELKLLELLPLWEIQLKVTGRSKPLAERGLAGWAWHDSMNLNSLGTQIKKPCWLSRIGHENIPPRRRLF